MSFFRFLTSIVAVLIFTQAAYAADICVSIDKENDNLLENDRSAVLMLAKQEVQEAGHTIVDEGCADAIVISNVKLGTSITVTAVRGDDQRRLKASGLEDLPNVCSQVIKSLLSGEPLAVAMDRTNVTENQASPKRAKADFLTTFRAGAMMHAIPSGVGPNFGAGMRVELDDWAIEAESSFGWTMEQTAQSGETQGLSITFGAHLGGLYFFDGQANHSGFAGLGVGYGVGVAGNEADGAFAGAGFDFKLSGGYELFRASTIRMFFQGDVILPTYMYRGDDGSLNANETRYNPTFMLSFGIGYVPDIVVGGFFH